MLMVACLEMTSGERGVSSDGLSFDRSCPTRVRSFNKLVQIAYNFTALSTASLALQNELHVKTLGDSPRTCTKVRTTLAAAACLVAS